MIIDCHGHYTTAPDAHSAWRDAQVAAYDAGNPAPLYPSISDAEIQETIEKNQLRLLTERGADMTIFSPRASTMAHHVGDRGIAETALANGRGHALQQPPAKLGGRWHVLGAGDLVACGNHSRQAIPPAIQACRSWYSGVP